MTDSLKMPNIYLNRDKVPKLKSGEWAWIIANREDTFPTHLVFGCPCDTGKCKINSYILVTNKGEHSWKWDGRWEDPTLTPSIQREGGCNWHGYLKQGKFVKV